MNRTELRAQLATLDLSQRPDEAPHRDRMIALLDTTPGCFERTSYPAHFTGSALIVNFDGSRALLHHHRKLDRWMQFGGHCDGDENVLRVAQREALEESGIPGLILASPRPFDLDIHTIPTRPTEPEHYHYDLRWVLIAPESAQYQCSEESHELRWFTPGELQTLPLDPGLQRLLRKWQALRARRAITS